MTTINYTVVNNSTATLNNKVTSDDIFLAYYSKDTLEDARREADFINVFKPRRLKDGQLAHCNARIYFALSCSPIDGSNY